MTNTNTVKKVTKVDNFGAIIEILQASTHPNKEALVKAMEHEIELLERKKATKSKSKTSQLTLNLNEIIVETLTKLGKPSTITEIMQANECLRVYNGEIISNQRVSRLANDMANPEKGNQRLVKVTEKKKSYFSVK